MDATTTGRQLTETAYDDDELTPPRESRAEARYAAMDVPVMPRKAFLKKFAAEYRPGQHVTFLGPTGRGKTRLAGLMLIAVQRANRAIKAYILHGKIKGRDDTIIQLSKAAELQMIRGGRPTATQRFKHKHFKKYRNGYVVRPLEKPGANVDEENQMLRKEFGRTLHKGYHASRKHPVIVVVDESHQVQVDLKLKSACEGPLMRGRPVCGEWNLVQRGRFVSQYSYDMAEWVLIFYDPVADNQERYGEIGGVDPKQLKYLSKRLKTFSAPDGSTYSQAICFHRSGDELFIVDV
jgi:energy-coupling factor transporter ATP-binding protein EcfA2